MSRTNRENTMPVMMVRHKVADFKQWKEVFDSMNEARRGYGWTAHEVYQDAGDPNTVTIVNHMRDIQRAKEYGTSDVLRAGMAKAGVVSAPEIMFLNDVDFKEY